MHKRNIAKTVKMNRQSNIAVLMMHFDSLTTFGITLKQVTKNIQPGKPN